jgi:hypothetical protein
MNTKIRNPISKASTLTQLLAAALFLSLIAFAALPASAQSYSIDWFTVDGGGGTSSGGTFSVTGTIGQPDAGHMSGGSYTIDGGFWGIIAVIQNTPPSPQLRIVRVDANNVLIAWPTSAVGFNLQQNNVIDNAGTWSAVPIVPTVVGSEYQVTITPPVGNKFYRLKNP